MIAVHHATNPTWGFGPDPVWPEAYTHVADVDVDDENHALVFQLTNTIDHHWWLNRGVTPNFDSPAFREVKGMKGTRSTSVGDIIVLSDGKVLRCANVGWVEVTPNTSTDGDSDARL